MQKVTKQLRIHGKVQGVYYRGSMREAAARLGITGWVRNRLDGTVEAVVQGDPESVATILRWAERGPAAAKVERVDASEVEAAESFHEFSQWPTA